MSLDKYEYWINQTLNNPSKIACFKSSDIVVALLPMLPVLLLKLPFWIGLLGCLFLFITKKVASRFGHIPFRHIIYWYLPAQKKEIQRLPASHKRELI